MSILFILLAVTAGAPAAFAGQPVAGTFGLGWYSPTAPVGGRVWVSPQIGIDIGLGYANDKALGGADSRVHINVGIPVNVVTTEHVNFFIRPGVEYQTNSRLDAAGAMTGTTIVTADLGAEWFVSSQFSLSVGHGPRVRTTGASPPSGRCRSTKSGSISTSSRQDPSVTPATRKRISGGRFFN